MSSSSSSSSYSTCHTHQVLSVALNSLSSLSIETVLHDGAWLMSLTCVMQHFVIDVTCVLISHNHLLHTDWNYGVHVTGQGVTHLGHHICLIRNNWIYLNLISIHNSVSPAQKYCHQLWNLLRVTLKLQMPVLKRCRKDMNLIFLSDNHILFFFPKGMLAEEY